jgi:CHAD domain-containing protein
MAIDQPLDRPLEIELKYRLLDLAAGERFLAAEALGPFRAVSAARAAQHEDRYLDTSDGALARAGYAARLRRTRGGTVVTVKSTTAVTDGALQRREELEGPADRAAEPHAWPPSAARSLILELCGDAPLVELVTVRQLRRKRRLKAPDATAELSLDEVDVVARGRVIHRFAELEAELTSGVEARLVELRPIFEADASLIPASGSKLDAALAATTADDGSPAAEASAAGAGAEAAAADAIRAVEAERTAVEDAARVERRAERGDRRAARAAAAESAAASGTPEPPRRTGRKKDKAKDAAEATADAATEAAPPRHGEGLVVGKTPGVLSSDNVAEAGRKVLRFHLARMIAREPGTLEGTDPEELHGMRVATRRMRAAWRVFGDGYRPDRTRRHRKRLREVAARLGAVRDLDVLIEEAEPYLAAQTVIEQRAIAPLFAAWRQQRDDARVLLARELDSDAYVRWVDEFKDFVRTEGLATASTLPTAPHRIRETAGSRIWAAYEQVRAYEPVMRWADVETLHELRITSKWLRYTLEFVRECLGPDVATLIARVVALQDHLGLMHDADVAASMVRSYLVEGAGRLSEVETAAIGRYLVDREKEVVRLRRTVGPAWRAIVGVSFRRGLGRTLAAL